MKIMFVGDTHGTWAYLEDVFYYAKELYKGKIDRVVQLGDLGWFPTPNYPVNFPENVETYDIPFYFIDGNHDDHHALQSGWTPKNAIYCPRGTLEEVDGLNILYLGGAHSIDWKYRKKGVSWFPEENITDEDLARALSHDKVDIVVSHTCPDSLPINGTLPAHVIKDYDIVSRGNREKLEEVRKKYNPKHWFFGHWHLNREWMPASPTYQTTFVCLKGDTDMRNGVVCIYDTKTQDIEYKLVYSMSN